MGKAKNTMYAPQVFAFMKDFIFEHPVNQLTEKYFKHLKTKNFMNEGCLCGQGQFSDTSRRTRKLFLLVEKVQNCSALKGTSQHLNKVIRENSCVLFFCFSVFTSFSIEDWLGSQLANFFTTHLILVTLQVLLQMVSFTG